MTESVLLALTLLALGLERFIPGIPPWIAGGLAVVTAILMLVVLL